MIRRLRKYLISRPVIFHLKNHTADKPKRMNDIRDTETEKWMYGRLVPDDKYDGGAYVETNDGKSRVCITLCSAILPI